MDIDRAAVAQKIVAPDSLQQHIAREGHAAVADQAGQQIELFLRERDLGAIAPGPARAGIYVQPAGLQHLAVASRLAIGAPHDRSDAREQLAQAERFGYVVVSAKLKAGDAIDLVLARSEHQYRHIALLAQNAADREAIQSWQHHIEDQQVGPLAAGEFERLNTVAGGEHTVALAFEVVAQCLGKGRIVFDEQSTHDFGRDILPRLAGRAEIYAYDFRTNQIPGEPPGVAYWRDVGTIEAYYEANLDLRSVSPCLNLYNRDWPLRTASYPEPPAKFTFDDEKRRGQAIDSIVSGGCILSGGEVRNSVLFRGVRVHAGALVEDSIILDNCDIGRRAKVRRAILDKNVQVPPDASIGYDLEHDRRNYYVTDSGIVVIEGNRSAVEISALVV